MKKEINVKGSWDSVTWAEFEKLQMITGDTTISKAEKEFRLIAALSGLSEEEVKTLDAVSCRKILSAISFLGDKVPKNMPKPVIEIAGVRHDVYMYPKDWIAAQFLDYQQIINEAADDMVPKALTCFIVPCGHSYNDGSYDMDKLTADIKENISVADIMGYSGFFRLQSVSYAEALADFSVKKAMKSRQIRRAERKKLKKNLRELKASLRHIGSL